MSDLDLELELLGLDDGVQIFGEHELKTSPLVSKDALDLSIANQAAGQEEGEQFVQRGLLGRILSIHSEDLQHKPKDVRLYMNLDAPSSGLVCGVQGSGKSHTVSCILESSLMVDRKIGTLPAPLSTIVFHYDEENGGRPCEAAYLSELKNGQGQGVKEVVVLVSPSNLNTRKKVYSNLEYVKVEALRISEKDLNASRMLCMMGADNLEQVPLYLHTALSILRDMGSDNFSYRAFRKRLDGEEFNKSQMAMLQLRLDLLDSFLKGDGEDITHFFKPGRLVIIDLSDPFVDSTTAAMLFDICLGLFIEWKVSTGKLIVLDEAHKYLTNADANQFTKKICSIIRQQRHLAARVIVSTQEPTVVPSSVLDLLTWIVCHRFSSPSWVKHLMHHMCVGEEEGNGSGKVSGEKDWSKKVMALRTGEALLCSPASLFVSESGHLATLSTGYAVIKTRPRLTRDGGASLLATVDLTETRINTGILTPESGVLGLSNPISAQPSEGVGSVSSVSIISQSSSPKPSGLPLRDLYTSTLPSLSSITRLGSTGSVIPVIPPVQPSKAFELDTQSRLASETPSSTHVHTPPPPQVSSVNIPSSSKPHATVAGPIPQPNSTLPPSKSAINQYKKLIDVMNELSPSYGLFINNSLLASKLITRWGSFWTGKFGKYLRTAATTNLITLRGDGDGLAASLHPSLRTTPPAHIPGPTPVSVPPSNPTTSNPSKSVPTPFKALVEVMRAIDPTSTKFIDLCQLGDILAKRNPGVYKAAGYKQLKSYLQAAEKAGLLQLREKDGHDEARLKL